MIDLNNREYSRLFFYYKIYCASTYDSCGSCSGRCSGNCYEDGSSRPTVSNTCQSSDCASGCSGPSLLCGGTGRSIGPYKCTGSCGVNCYGGCYRSANCKGLATV